MDDHYGLERDLKTYKIKNSELIDFINDYWDIGIVEYDTTKDYGIPQEYLTELDY